MSGRFHSLGGGRVPGKSIFLISFVFFLFSAVNGWCQQEPVGNAYAVSGTAYVEREGKRAPLNQGDPVFLKDVIHTGDKSSVEIVFPDESQVKVSEKTDLEISEYLYNPSEKKRDGLISMASGKARFAVQDLGEFMFKPFRVQTPTAIAGTRGTGYVVSYDKKKRRTEIFCIEHSIMVFSTAFPDKPVACQDNQITWVDSGTLPTSPRDATSAERTKAMSGVEKLGKPTVHPSAGGLPGRPGAAAVHGAVTTAPTVTNPVIAAIVTEATKNLSSGEPVQQVVAQAMQSAANSGITPQEVILALSQSLMQAGIANGANGTSLAGEITSATLVVLTATGADSTTVIQTISLMAQGIGTGAGNSGLDTTPVLNQVQGVVLAQGGDNSAQLGQVIANIISTGNVASTYTPPAPAPPPPTPPPPPPSNVPQNVSDSFTPAASGATR